MKTPALVLTLSLIAVAGAQAQLPYLSGFDDSGLCEWDDVAGMCLTSAGLEQSVDGAYTFCVTPLTFTYTYSPFPLITDTLTAVLCGQSLCSNGFTGCDATLHVTSAAFDLVSSQATFTATLDDAAFPVQFSLNGAIENDTLNMTGASATGDVPFTTTSTCFRDAWQVVSVGQPHIDADANVSFSGGSLATIANLAIPFWQPILMQQIDSEAGPVLQSNLPSPLPGTWICSGSQT